MKDEKKSINHINALFAKVNIQKLQLQHAHRLFMSVILPSVAYGCSIFTDSLEHAKPVAVYFWKRWSALSKYASTSRLLHHIFENDFLNIEKSTGQTRRAIASYYNNGLHNAICKIERCHKPDCSCDCKYCDSTADNYNHLLDNCSYLKDLQPRTRLVKILHRQ